MTMELQFVSSPTSSKTLKSLRTLMMLVVLRLTVLQACLARQQHMAKDMLHDVVTRLLSTHVAQRTGNGQQIAALLRTRTDDAS